MRGLRLMTPEQTLKGSITVAESAVELTARNLAGRRISCHVQCCSERSP